MRAEIWRVLGSLRGAGMSMLVVDKNLEALLALADRHCVIEKGQLAWQGDGAALRRDADLVRQYLAV